MEAVVHEYGGSACHPGETNANFRKADVYERDLDAGYQEKGTCVSNPAHRRRCRVRPKRFIIVLASIVPCLGGSAIAA